MSGCQPIVSISRCARKGLEHRNRGAHDKDDRNDNATPVESYD